MMTLRPFANSGPVYVIYLSATCPCCYGNGTRRIFIGNIFTGIDEPKDVSCEYCEGKGSIWKSVTLGELQEELAKANLSPLDGTKC